MSTPGRETVEIPATDAAIFVALTAFLETVYIEGPAGAVIDSMLRRLGEDLERYEGATDNEARRSAMQRINQRLHTALGAYE